MYENYERIKMIKHVHENDEDIHQFDMDWLIRQAERADEYDRNLISLEDNRHYVSGLEQQNKRYRETLENIRSVKGEENFDHYAYMMLEIIEWAEEALKEESE